MKLVKQKNKYIDKEGKEKEGYNFYIIQNDIKVVVKPVFKDDYKLLLYVAEEVSE